MKGVGATNRYERRIENMSFRSIYILIDEQLRKQLDAIAVTCSEDEKRREEIERHRQQFVENDGENIVLTLTLN